jgi:putative membrane protein insertion efficiency factor
VHQKSGTLVRRRPAVLIGIGFVRAYQLLFAPLAGGACRFEPSCSRYAIDAIDTHGLRRGAWLAVKRVARCHPLSRAGFDPVPARGAPSRGEGR